MMEFLTCRKIGFMFGCFGLILAHLGRFWAGIAECGDHVGLWLSSWCFDGVSVMSIALVVCVRFHGIVGCGCVVWLGSLGCIGGMSLLIWWCLGGVLLMSWGNSYGVYCAGAMCPNSFCVTGAILWHRFRKMSCAKQTGVSKPTPDATLKAPEVLQVKKVQRALFTSATPRRYWRKVPPLIPMLWGKVAAETSGTLK